MVQAAGLLAFRKSPGGYEVLLTHPGGPFWAHKDQWSIPKGEVDEGETLLQTMEREFIEETGFRPPLDKVIELGNAKARGDKINYIWAAEANFDIAEFTCDSMVKMEWPPKSGTYITFPENDRADWFSLTVARDKLYESQRVFIDRLAALLNVD